MKNTWLILALILIFIAGVIFRTWVYENSRTNVFIPFTNVNGFHYYFAAKVARGEPIPDIEYKVQEPEGMKIRGKESIFMEYIVGWLYRPIAGFKVPFDDFVRFCVRVWGSLAVFACYGVIKKLKNHAAPALGGALLYAVSLAALNRSAGFGFLRENFTLLILFGQLFFLVSYLKDNKIYNLLLSGICLFVALASWQFTQFYLLILMGFFLMCWLGNKEEDKKEAVNLTLTMTVFSSIAGLTVPYLRENAFLISFPMLFSYAMLAGLLMFKLGGRVLVKCHCESATVLWRTKQSLKKFILFILILAGLFLITLQFSKNSEYSHVYGMLFSQIKYLGRHPADPGLISFDTKLLWETSHSAPGIRIILQNLWVVLLACMIPLALIIRDFFRKKLDLTEKMLLYMTAIFGLGYIFIDRLLVFLIFFLCIYAGRLALVGAKRHLGVAVMVLLIILETGRTSEARNVIFEVPATVDSINWVNKNTKSDDVILSSPRSSPEILAYTGRPIVLHAKLESKEIREKTKRWALALFEPDEEKLYGLCREWNVRYFVFPVGTYNNIGFSSWRYITNRLLPDEKALGYRLEAMPEESQAIDFEFGGRKFTGTASAGFKKPDLKHFELVYKNRGFNIYKVK